MLTESVSLSVGHCAHCSSLGGTTIEATEIGRRRSLIDEKNKEKGFKRRAQAGPGGPRGRLRPAGPFYNTSAATGWIRDSPKKRL